MTQDDRHQGAGMGPDDLAVPELKLIQHVGGPEAKAAGAAPGDFYISLTDEIIKAEVGFDIVVVDIGKTRTYWGRSEIMDEPPECASVLVTRGGGTSMAGEDCSKCPHLNEAPWLLKPEERRQKCLLNYHILAIVKGGLPILIRASGVSSLPAKELYTQLTLNRQVAPAWWRAKTHVSSVARKTPSGDVFAMKFGKLELIEDPVMLEELKAQSESMLGTHVALPEGIEDREAEAQPAKAQITEPAKEGVVEPPAEPPTETVAPNMNF